jgi:hypothetical protein
LRDLPRALDEQAATENVGAVRHDEPVIAACRRS